MARRSKTKTEAPAEVVAQLPPAPPQVAGQIAILKLDHAVGGYLYGLRQPFLKARVQFVLPPELDWTSIDQALRQVARVSQDEQPVFSADPVNGAAERIIHWAAELESDADQPVFERGRILGGSARIRILALPTVNHGLATSALHAVVKLINMGLQGVTSPAKLVRSVEASIEEFTNSGRKQGLGTSHMIKLIEAAHQKRIPWFPLVGNTYQIGYGARARWLDATFTDATSRIGVALARNKMAAAAMLRHAGLPAPMHECALDEEAAVQVAERLGYPIVLKPLDADGGLGVSVGIKDQAAVRRAYAEARRYSDKVLLEQFVEGRDYRLIVLHGRLVWALERVPGGVVGDGKTSVRNLVAALNADPRRAKGKKAVLSQLDFDQEAMELLAEQGLDGDAVPTAGRHIRLRGAANVGRGGVPVAAFDNVHPDNKLLAERAASALRLDLAGIDLLIPDISRSWKETGAGICDINSQPNIGSVTAGHLYGEILDNLLRGDGRIPIGLIIAPPADSKASGLVGRMVAAAGVRAGVAVPEGVWLGEDHVVLGPTEAFVGSRLLMGDLAVDVAVVVVNDTRPMVTGLPFDRCTVVALAGSQLADVGDNLPAFNELARALLPSSLSTFVVNAEDPACMAFAPQLRGGRVILYATSIGIPTVLEHCARGGTGVWIRQTLEGACVVVSEGPDKVLNLQLAAQAQSGQIENHRGDDIVLAVAVAASLGCREDQLQHVLGTIGLRANRYVFADGVLG